MNVRYDMVACYVARPDPAGISHELLQVRRAKDDYMGGTWQIVRGRHEGDERAWQAALRELKEETNLIPREFYKLSSLEVFYLTIDETIWHCPAFIALINREDDIQLNEEHDAHRWVRISEAPTHFMWPGEHAAIAELTREILNDGPTKPFLRIPIP